MRVADEVAVLDSRCFSCLSCISAEATELLARYSRAAATESLRCAFSRSSMAEYWCEKHTRDVDFQDLRYPRTMELLLKILTFIFVLI